MADAQEQNKNNNNNGRGRGRSRGHGHNRRGRGGHPPSQPSSSIAPIPSHSPSVSSPSPSPASAFSAAAAVSSSSAPSNPPPQSNRGGRGRGRGHGGVPRFVLSSLDRSHSQSSSSSASSALSASAIDPTKFASSSSLAQSIIGLLLSGRYECLICSEFISRRSSVWSCSNCFLLAHHSCMAKWVQAKKNLAGNIGPVSWPCPQCQYLFTGPLPVCRCYCGRHVDPEANPYLTPHSCGSVCGKTDRRLASQSAVEAGGSRFTSCSHPCTELCHPGACASCSVLLPESACPCGRTRRQLRCGDDDKSARVCSSICGHAKEACSVHPCERRCHTGPHGPCGVVVSMTCGCGRLTEERPCAQGTRDEQTGKYSFVCSSTSCDKLLDCGNHRCRLACHVGPCPGCERLPSFPQSCACGGTIKAAWKRSSCLDPFPECGEICGKSLGCLGGHGCPLPCHDSPCPPCPQTVKRQCECGHEVLAVPCHRAAGEAAPRVRCSRVCRARMSCNRHVCPEKCCPPSQSAHLCVRVCGRPLECGRHTDDNFCHDPNRPCKPCGVVYRDGLSCPCGRTRAPPLSVCSQIRLDCKFPCSRTRPCGHSCRSLCHVDGSDCPPCVQLTTKVCAGGHTEMKNIPCHVQSPSCGIPCRRPLNCGSNHFCLRPCHAGDCDQLAAAASRPPGAMKGRQADERFCCGQKCGAIRPCSHKCVALCHSGLPCPDTPCQESITIKCACGRISRSVRCSSTTSRVLECDSQCEIEQRNARFRDALSLASGASADTRPLIPYPAEILDLILSQCLLDYLIKVERVIGDWLRSSEPTKSLTVARSDYRWLVHQLASYYSLVSESFDHEPNRSIRLLRTPSSCAPSFLLSVAVRQYLANRQSHIASRTVSPACLMHFFNLDFAPRIQPSELHVGLREWDGQYRLNWLNATHAIAVFQSPAVLQQVRSAFTRRGFLTAPDPAAYAASEASAIEEQYRDNALFRPAEAGKTRREKGAGQLVEGADGFVTRVHKKVIAGSLRQANEQTWDDGKEQQHAWNSQTTATTNATIKHAASASAAPSQASAAAPPLAPSRWSGLDADDSSAADSASDDDEGEDEDGWSKVPSKSRGASSAGRAAAKSSGKGKGKGNGNGKGGHSHQTADGDDGDWEQEFFNPSQSQAQAQAQTKTKNAQSKDAWE